MIGNSRISEIVLLFIGIFQALLCVAQDCAGPAAICPQGDLSSFTYQDGAASGVGSDFCFADAPNAVFYSFQTLNTDDFPSIDYSDSTATLFLNLDSCLADTSLGIAVFSAGDACDPGTFASPVLCESDLAIGGSFTLESLEPATTYYIMVTGLDEGAGPSECSFGVGVSGPALEYDLDLDAFPQENPDRSDIFEGETVVLTANEDYENVQWSGPELNSQNGNEVTADPEGVDVTVTYTATAEIDGCIFTDMIDVYIAPAIMVSNAFSPNGDGINDTWEILNIDEWPNAQIFLYSRWGNKVFQTTNYNNDWGGDELPAATYYYVIELNPIDFNADPITGSVTIMR